MFCRLGDGRIGGPSLEFLCVPKFESAILKSTGNDTLRMVCVGRSPSDIVKSNNFSRLDKAIEANIKSYLESVVMLTTGWSSMPCSWLSRDRSQISSLLSSEKSASTAPAFVPVTIVGFPEPGDHAKVAVRGISRRRTMAAGLRINQKMN